jgi:hypothetical protein
MREDPSLSGLLELSEVSLRFELSCRILNLTHLLSVSGQYGWVRAAVL